MDQLKKHLERELLLSKKYILYSNMCYDSELKNLCFNASQIHKKNYENILKHLNENWR